MKKTILSLLAALIAVIGVSAQQAPAFPGAEGYGRYATGWRGGKVIHVTNLNDSGEGSFREAVKGSEPKIVVFDVGGIIELNSNLNIGANTYVAGQTAPGMGITLRYYSVNPNGNNIVMRFIRIRRGQERDVNDGADASTARHFTNMMLDHCSFSWSIDEIASFYDNRNFTMQWCTLAEALTNAGHNKGAHGYGGIWGGKGASFHHNFLAHMENRSPRFNGARYTWTGYDQAAFANTVLAERVDFRNCLMYNWGGGGCYGGPGGGFINMINNYYKAGPATSYKNRVTTCSEANSTTASDCDKKILGLYSRYFIQGNYVNGYGANYDWKGVAYDNNKTSFLDNYNMYGQGEGARIQIKLNEEIEVAPVTTHAAETAYEKVRLYAGASLARDEQDTRYAEECLTGTATFTGSNTAENKRKPGIIDVVADQGGYYLSSSSRPSYFDRDKDGIADEWEYANGLDPEDPSDAMAYTIDSKKKIYSNIEVYINSLAQDIMLDENSSAIEGKDVKDYYPAYYEREGVKVNAVNPDLFPDHIVQTGDATISWALANASTPTASVVSENLQPNIGAVGVELASVFSWGSVRTQGDSKLIEIAPSVNDKSANKSHYIKFYYEIAGDCAFQPTNVSFKISKNGTDAGNFSAYWVDADGNEITLDDAQDMVRNSVAPNYLAYKKDLIGYQASKKGALLIVPYNINGENSKKLSLGDVVISGIITGASGINSASATGETTIEYHNLQGVKVGNNHKGVVLKTVKNADGTKKVTKIIR